MYMNYWKSLSRLYDREVYKQCEQYRIEVIECMRNSFNDDFICKETIDNFEKCTNDFDKKFREHFIGDKHKNKQT